MSLLPQYRKDVLDNPIQRHEREHIRREGISWFAYGMYALALLAICLPILLGLLRQHFFWAIHDSYYALILFNLIAIFAIEMRIINNSAESFRREFQGKTWDLLILTGADTWRLVIGKWLGVIRGHWRDTVFLYVLRVAAFTYGIIFHNLRQDGFAWRDATILDIRLDITVVMTVALIFAVFLVLEIMLVASLPMALSLFKPTRKGATWLALGLRAIVPFAFVIAVLFVTDIPYKLNPELISDYQHREWIDTIRESLTVPLADNGFVWSSYYINPYHLFNRESSGNIFVFFQMIGIGLYLLWIWVMLRFAKYMAHEMNVSAPGFEPKIKPKHPDRYKMQMATAPTEVIQPKVRTVPKVTVYQCEVLRYDRDTAQLEIAVYHQGESQAEQTIRFAGVSYFTGMMRWRTTDITVATDDNLERFANQHHIDYDRLSGEAKLYELQSMDSPIYVIATGVLL